MRAEGENCWARSSRHVQFNMSRCQHKVDWTWDIHSSEMAGKRVMRKLADKACDVEEENWHLCDPEVIKDLSRRSSVWKRGFPQGRTSCIMSQPANGIILRWNHSSLQICQNISTKQAALCSLLYTINTGVSLSISTIYCPVNPHRVSRIVNGIGKKANFAYYSFGVADFGPCDRG